jgi:hypothetical protein
MAARLNPRIMFDIIRPIESLIYNTDHLQEREASKLNRQQYIQRLNDQRREIMLQRQ